jgi:hypothetical protein
VFKPYLKHCTIRIISNLAFFSLNLASPLNLARKAATWFTYTNVLTLGLIHMLVTDGFWKGGLSV